MTSLPGVTRSDVGISRDTHPSGREKDMRKKLFVATTLLVLASVVAPALAVTAPPGLHKEPAVSKVPSHVCARCHGCPE